MKKEFGQRREGGRRRAKKEIEKAELVEFQIDFNGSNVVVIAGCSSGSYNMSTDGDYS